MVKSLIPFHVKLSKNTVFEQNKRVLRLKIVSLSEETKWLKGFLDVSV